MTVVNLMHHQPTPLLQPVSVCWRRGPEQRGGGGDTGRSEEETRCTMGKSNSKLKPEVVEELTRKTYCEYRSQQVENL